jgi:hypothetical protein
LKIPAKIQKRKKKRIKRQIVLSYLPFLLPLPIEIKDKERNMKCRNCNNEVNEKEKNCPYCNTPLNNNDTDNGPTLGRGMVAFIILGTIFLVAFGFYYYGQHKNDPEYTQTAIEPDSNLADNNKAKFDTIVRDTTAKDSTEKQEEEQAEKVFNSIRRSNRSSHKSSSNDASSSSADKQSSTSESSSGEVQPIAPAASKPRIESIETD